MPQNFKIRIWFVLVWLLGFVLFELQAIAENALKELPPVRLESGVDKVYSKPFVLKKENVLDIATTLLKKASELPNKTQFLIHVTRSDDRFFEASNIEELFTDPNSPTREIDSVSFVLYDLQEDKFQGGDKPRQLLLVAYQNFRGPQVRAKITGANISWSLLTADELNAQIERTLVSNWNITRILTLVLGILLVFSMLWILYRFSYRRIANATPSTYIVMHVFQLVLGIAGGALLLGFLYSSRVVDWLKSSNGVFSWGDMSEAYSRQQAFGDSLFWTVAVGFVVSLITNLITARMTSKKATAPAH
jgi:hypothetical protein